VQSLEKAHRRITLGVLDTARQREALRRVMDEEIVPGLDALGLGASHAWAAREKLAGFNTSPGPEPHMSARE